MLKKLSITIATRKSPLALWQANWVKDQLLQVSPELNIQVLGLTTTADKITSLPLMQIGGKDLFVKELEEALLEGRADIAVHSMKDVPMTLPRGLCLPVICERADPRDVWVSTEDACLANLPVGALVGTSSLRRQSQLYAKYPHLRCVMVRGNVGSRLLRLDQGTLAGLILAAAGLHRLNLAKRITAYLSVEESMPAPGQGALGIECRSNDISTQACIMALNHANTEACVQAERSLCQQLGAGCQVPLGAYAEMADQQIHLRGTVASPDGKQVLRAEQVGAPHEATFLGQAVAEKLLRQGAAAILKLSSD